MPDNTLSTLEKIRIKIRRLTKSPSISQIADDTIDDYINTFILYDFPSHLKTFNLRKTLTFYTEPFKDTYEGEDIVPNFNNIYTSIYENIYISGRRATYTQDRDQMFTIYPRTETKAKIGQGNGVTVAYAGTLKSNPVLRNYVMFSSIDANNDGLAVYDDGDGNLIGDAVVGAINYVTGAYAFTLTSAPANGETVYSQTVPYVPSIPTTVLYHHDQFMFRPVPDQPYRVEVEVAQRPTELINDGDMPEISQQWQYIAYGAAKKIFEDRMDMESVQKIMSEFKEQELLVNRRTIDQISSQRVATIYSHPLRVRGDLFDNN